MYFTIDEEAIQLFESPFAFHALHDFRFFREETEKSIDTIYVCNLEAQLEVQKGENVFFLYPQQGQEVSNWGLSLYSPVMSWKIKWKTAKKHKCPIRCLKLRRPQ